MALRALIFDVDGVLVQSMDAHHEAYRRAFADYSVDVKKEEVFANEGRRSKEVIETLAKAKSLRLTPEQVEEMNKKKQQVFYSFGPLPLYPGVPEIIAKAKAEGLKLAAVTGTTRANVEQHLGALHRKLDVVVAQEDVRLTKPDPEPYLAALAKLGVKANEAIVVENAPLGIRSAKSAGLRVIGVTSTVPRDALAMADVIVPSIKDVWAAVEKLR